MTNLFVGGLAYAINNDQLRDLFAPFGEVASAKIITDKYSGQSKGFAFVEMVNDDEAQKAIQELDGSTYEGRRIGVSVAKPREERPSNGGGYNQNNNNNRRGGNGGFDRDRRNNRR